MLEWHESSKFQKYSTTTEYKRYKNKHIWHGFMNLVRMGLKLNWEICLKPVDYNDI